MLMTVAELNEELKEFPPETEVIVIAGSCDDECEPSPQLVDGKVRL
jgi:hypothetical protein